MRGAHQRVSRRNKLIEVVLLGYGGPASLEEVEPFLKRALKKDKVSPSLIKKTAEKYKAIGGRSPYLEITKRQATLLQEILTREGKEVKVLIGMAHSKPLIEEAAEDIFLSKPAKVVALSLTPYYSSLTSGTYFLRLKKALDTKGVGCRTVYVTSWYNHPLYLRAWEEKIRAAIKQFSLEKRDSLQIIFSAHSLPKKLIDKGDPYVEELKETIRGVLKHIGNTFWYLAFQSSGRGGKWLGPYVEEVLEGLAQERAKEVLIVPIGFITDHLETLYDIDIVYRRKAKELGLKLFRAEALNDSSLLLDAMADIIRKYLDRD